MILTKGVCLLKTKLYSNNDVISLDTIKTAIYRADPSLAPTITDIEILRYRDSAINKIEFLINTSIIASEYEFFLGTYSNNNSYSTYSSAGFVVSKPYVKEVLSIEYLSEGIYLILDTDLYRSELENANSCIVFKEDQTLPKHDTFGFYTLNKKAVKTTFKSGLFNDANSIDATIINAICTYVVETYNGCGDDSVFSSLKNSISEYIFIDTFLY